jgi:hypothetical protein
MAIANAQPGNTAQATSGPLSVSDAARRLSALDQDPIEDTLDPEAVEDLELEEGEEELAADSDEVTVDDLEDEDAIEDDDEQSENDGDPTYDVAGERVTLDELRKGYLRQSDYTRKRQEESVEHQQMRDTFTTWDAQREAAEQSINQQAAHLTQSLAHINALLPQAPDPELENEDPIEFARQDLEHRRALEQIQEAEALAGQYVTQAQAQQEGQMKTYLVGQQQALMQFRPELQDKARREEFTQTVVNGAAEFYNAGPEDLKQVHDHRLLAAIEDGVKYRRLLAKKTGAGKPQGGAPVRGANKARKPAEAQGKKAHKVRKQAARKSGSVRDAASVLAHLIPD